MATARAASLPSAVVRFAPSWPTQGLPFILAIWPDEKSKLPLRRKGTKTATGGVSSGSVMLRASSYSYTDTVFHSESDCSETRQNYDSVHSFLCQRIRLTCPFYRQLTDEVYIHRFFRL